MTTAIIVPSKKGLVDVFFYEGDRVSQKRYVFNVTRAVAEAEIAEAGATLLRQMNGFPIPADVEIVREDRRGHEIMLKSKAKNRKAKLTMTSDRRWYAAAFYRYDSPEATHCLASSARKATAVHAALNYIEKG